MLENIYNYLIQSQQKEYKKVTLIEIISIEFVISKPSSK